MKLTKHARHVIAAAIVAVGCLAGGTIWALATPTPEDPLGDYAHSKRYQYELERFGGKSAVLGDELQEWLASLFRGPTLGLTICGISIIVAGGFLFFTREKQLAPR